MPAEVRAIEADIPVGMMQVEDGDAKVLFVRDANGLRAFQAICPRYGAPSRRASYAGTSFTACGTRRPSTSATARCSSRRPSFACRRRCPKEG